MFRCFHVREWKNLFFQVIFGFFLVSGGAFGEPRSFFSKPATLSQLKSMIDKVQRVENEAGTDAVWQRCTLDFQNDLDACMAQNERAYKKGLITDEGVVYLRSQVHYVMMGIDENDEPYVAMVCPCGCFAAQTRILTKRDGFAQWVQAKEVQSLKDELLALNDTTTLSQVKQNPSSQLIPKKIEMKTAGEETPDLVVFSLSNGQTLKVTSEHGVILNDGRVVPAKEVVKGQSFISVENGEDVQVQMVSREKTKDLVYNFLVNSETPAGSVIASEGVLVGSLFLQEPENRKEAHGIALRNGN